MTDTGIVWEEPATDRHRGRARHYTAVAAQLRAHPGQWANLGEMHSSLALRIRRGEIVAFRPAGAFEATTRGINKGHTHATIYARFIGEDPTL